MASPKDQQQNFLHWGTGKNSIKHRNINNRDCSKNICGTFFCRYPIILQCQHSMSATGRMDSASVAASLPNPNSTVSTRVFYIAVGCQQSATTPVLCLVYPPGNSLSAILDGEARLTFLNRGEDYVMNMPYAHCKGQHALLMHSRAAHEPTLTRYASSSQASCMAP